MNEKTVKFIKYFSISFIGTILVILYLYADILVGNYKLSYYNFAYDVAPWKSEEVDVKGPPLTDPSDSALPSLYDVFYQDNGFSNEWNSNIALGAPAGTFDKMYPLDFVYFLPFDYAVLVKSILEFAFAFIGMYLLLRVLKLNNISSVIGGICYCFSSVMVLWAGWPHSDVTAFAPFVVLFTYLLMKEGKILYLALLSLFIYIFTVAGMPTYSVYFLYFAGFYALFLGVRDYLIFKEKRDIKKLFKHWVMFGIASFVGLLASAPYLYSTIYGINSDYVESRAFLGKFTIGLKYLRTMIYPYFKKGFEKSVSLNETTIYAGMFVVIMLPFVFAGIKRKKEAYYYNFMALINFLFIFTHALDFIFTRVPAINTSLKIRVLVVLIFCNVVSISFNLNDIIENTSSYRKRAYVYIPLFAAYIVTIMYLASGKLYSVMDKEDETYWMFEKQIIVAASVFVLISIFILIYSVKLFKKFKVGQIFLYALFFVVVWDMAGFAKDYFPLIDDSASNIPVATDSIRYLQENMTDTDRFTAIGEWILFPNIGEMYGLNDVRTHDFIVKNSDITTYYNDISMEYTNRRLEYLKRNKILDDEELLEIVNNSSVTQTRARFLELCKPSLLSYIGTKYVLGENLGKRIDIGEKLDEPEKNVIGLFTPGLVIEQEILAEDGFRGIEVAVANYDHENTTSDYIILELQDKEGKILEQKKYKFSYIQDNMYLRFGFNNEYKAGEYILKIYSDMAVMTEDTVSVWASDYVVSGYSMKINGQLIDKTTVMQLIYNDEDYKIEKICDDGLIVVKLNDYAKKVEIAENVEKCLDEKEVLFLMEKGYNPGTMYTSEDVEDLSGDIGNDTVTLEKYSDDEIIINCNLSSDRYIMINDYYNTDWKAYVNGKEEKIIKSNYLTRAVLVKAGKDTKLVLKYENNTKKKIYYISLFAGIVFIIMFIFGIVMMFKEKRHGEVK
ncbi:hypothetical protein SAMN02910289_00541 [Lachnospiraceae bacterium RM5]|nr:hypothetical protein SAMN02910289_00541 [Lachnospiraceae bacterium RM5]